MKKKNKNATDLELKYGQFLSLQVNPTCYDQDYHNDQ